MHGWWRKFWSEWVPTATHGEPYCVVHNGDLLEGVHHGVVTTISNNLADQAEIAYRVLHDVVPLCGGRLYVVRGTEAHAGKSGENEEALARRLGAIPNSDGQYARHDLWLNVVGRLLHFMHHVSTCSSNSYEATAIIKELVEEYNEAARWGRAIPDAVVRSHRHRSCLVAVPTYRNSGVSFVTPGWQLKTPFAWRVAGARISEPQIGGCLIRCLPEGLSVYTKCWSIGRTEQEVCAIESPTPTKSTARRGSRKSKR